MYILLAQRRHMFLEKRNVFKNIWELTVYVQVYLFIILYFYWIATNIIQYLLYLVVLVYEYLSVFTQLCPRKWGQLLYQSIMQPFFRNRRTFHGEGGTPILMHGRKVPQWWHHFCNCWSDLVPIVWRNQIQLTPSFCRKKSVWVYHI